LKKRLNCRRIGEYPRQGGMGPQSRLTGSAFEKNKKKKEKPELPESL